MTSFESIVKEIMEFTKLGMNVMLSGKHGVGKTAAVQEACKRMGLSMWYASAPLLDPDVDLGGIPVPNKKTGGLDFFTHGQLLEAEVLFLDELNRASPRTLNMVFELVQFKSIHGKRLPKLRAVHTGINPPGQGQYDVQALDDALVDRFHGFIEMKAEFPAAVIQPLIGDAKSAAMQEWWEKHCKQVFISPRRLHYTAELEAAGMPIHRAFNDAKVPVGRLREMLAAATLEAAKIEKATPVTVHVSQEPKFQKILNDPGREADNIEFTRIVTEELGLTEEQIWNEVLRLRQVRIEKAAPDGK